MYKIKQRPLCLAYYDGLLSFLFYDFDFFPLSNSVICVSDKVIKPRP